jgi:DNA-binding NtrC family response regulator
MQNPTNLRVFVVDDERVIAETLAVILRQNGFWVGSFTDPLVALTKASSEPPDLLISDVMMPQISGIDLAMQLRSLHPTCKVLLFSGQAATADLLLKAHKDGRNFDLLLKPVHPTDLLVTIRRIVSKKEPGKMVPINSKAS